MWIAWFSMVAASAAIASSDQPDTGRANGVASCVLSDVLRLNTGDRLQAMDDFRTGLSARDRARLDLALPRDADGGIERCDAVDRSRASCEAAAYLPALRRTGLMSRFVTVACSKTFHAGTLPGDRSIPTAISRRAAQRR